MTQRNDRHLIAGILTYPHTFRICFMRDTVTIKEDDTFSLHSRGDNQKTLGRLILAKRLEF